MEHLYNSIEYPESKMCLPFERHGWEAYATEREEQMKETEEESRGPLFPMENFCREVNRGSAYPCSKETLLLAFRSIVFGSQNMINLYSGRYWYRIFFFFHFKQKFFLWNRVIIEKYFQNYVLQQKNRKKQNLCMRISTM